MNIRIPLALACTASLFSLVQPTPAFAQADQPSASSGNLEEIVVTARRVEELAQDVPIPVSVIKGDLVSDAGAFNVNRMKEMIPTVQFYSTNPRNSAINIRGLGAPFGLTNDGLEPGVGLYIDGVFFARPASAALDFLDVDQVEVLRGPEGTLFGKNTTAGWFHSFEAMNKSPDAMSLDLLMAQPTRSRVRRFG